MGGDSLSWGLVPNNRWEPIEGAQFGQGIVRVAPRLTFRPPNLPRHCQWHQADGVYWMDIALREFDPSAIRSLDEIARELHGSNRIPPGHPILEELDFIADRLLRFLDHLAKTGQSVGLIAPPNVVLVIREQLNYVETARIARQVSDQQLAKSDLEPDKQDLLRRAAQGRFVVLPDLGFSCPPMMSGHPSWLNENHEFRFIWDQPPQEEHVAISEPWRINRSVARMFAWVLTGRSLKSIPAVSPNERGLIGPCWDVLANAVDGKYETVEQFRLALQGAPLSTFAFGKAIPIPPPVEDGLDPPRRGWRRWLAAASLLIVLLAVAYFLFIPTGPEPPRPVCCDQVTKASGEAFYSLLLEYDVLAEGGSSAEVSMPSKEVATTPSGAAAPAPPKDDPIVLVNKLQRRLEQVTTQMAIVEELLSDETLLSATKEYRAEQERCAAKLRDATLEDIRTEVVACIEMSKGEAAVGPWDLVDQVKSLDKAVDRAFRMRGLDKTVEPARETLIKLETLVIGHRGHAPAHTWHLDALKSTESQPPP